MTDATTHLGSTRTDAAWTYGLLAGGGALLLGLLPLVLGWLGDFPFVPFRDALVWVAGFDAPWTHVVRPAVGLLAGAGAAWWSLHDEHRLEVTDEALVVARRGDRRRIGRDAVVGVHRDGRRVVIDGTEGRRLLDARVGASRDRVHDAFTAHGYPYESE